MKFDKGWTINDQLYFMAGLVLFVMIITATICNAQRHHIALVFSEPIDSTTLLNADNYALFDANMEEVLILFVYPISDSVIAIAVDFLDYKNNFIIRADNIKDLAGNLINENNSAWFYFDGYDPDEQKPYLIIK